jgi:hypothetical protein
MTKGCVYGKHYEHKYVQSAFGLRCYYCLNPPPPEAAPPQGEPNPFLVAAQQQAREILAHREKYLKAWIAETGLMPSECELVEEIQHDGNRRVYVRRRTTLAERSNRSDE